MIETSNPYVPGSDAWYLQEALFLAHSGLGWTAPNPPVGCILVRDGEIVGQGFHAQDGARHAEHEALLAAGNARGATCYTTLEPCSVESRTPSCCHLLADYGVSAVVFGAVDADVRSRGRSIQVLEGLGISARPPHGEGSAGVQRACERFIDAYSHSREFDSPFLHLKLALSMDGKVACANGASQWLSGPESLGFAHYLRQKYDAILVGYRTVQVDDSRLTVRPEVLDCFRQLVSKPRNPVRVILDPHWELASSLADSEGAVPAIMDMQGEFREHLPRLVIVGSKAAAERSGLPELPGICVCGIETDDQGNLRFASLREELWKLGVQSVLVEGGAGVAQSLLAQREADKVSFVYTPHLLGSDALGFSPELGLTRVSDGMALRDVLAVNLGNDVLLSGYPVWG